MLKANVAGLKIDFLTKAELLGIIRSRLVQNQPAWITTLYSEFLYAGLQNPKIMTLFNQADVALADGIGIFWAKRFLSLPLTAQNYWLKILQAYWQATKALITLPFKKHLTLPGSELIWDLTRLAAENSLSIYLLGGFDDTPKLVSQKLVSSFYSGRYKMRIQYSNKNADDLSVIDDINNFHPDMLFVAYGPIKQEKWIFENREKLTGVKLFMGVGGTFDYIAGKRLAPPKYLRLAGLEWLWRLLTQPYRINRIYNATVGLILSLIKYKIFNDLPFRPNVVVGIINTDNKILICQRNPKDITRYFTKQFFQNLAINNYWQLPQGGINAGENLINAAQREAKEETGLKNLELYKISPTDHSYVWESATRTFWGNRNYLYKGQKQNIVYFKFFGSDSDIKLDNREIINFKWVALSDLAEVVHPERLTIAKIIQADLKEITEKGII